MIWASYAIIDDKSDNPAVPADTLNFVWGIFGVAIALLVLRVAIFIFRQVKKPIGVGRRIEPIRPIIN